LSKIEHILLFDQYFIRINYFYCCLYDNYFCGK